ncbi:MAG: ABC transporter ATP-binding protein [Anaerolineae bacterium]|nr:ABC transporter ATP-binding protein [Anaerolineae bacterium]
MSHNRPVIQTENLSKDYPGRKGQKRALNGLTLSVQPGEIFGYLGPNGAGKTTTIRLLLDFIRPTQGSATIFGQDVRTHAVELHKRIGFLPGELNLWKHLTGLQVVDTIGRIRGGLDKNYMRQLTERLGLDLSLRVRSYSTGNKRKLGLVIALMNKPDLLMLDEPSSGLDPLMQQTFNELMLEVQKEGRTVFLSSHILSEVQAICDRVAILRDGQLKAVERVTDLTHADFRWVTLRLREAVTPAQLATVAGVSDISQIEDGLRLRLTGDFDPLLRAISPYYVQDIQVQEPSLEEIFLTYYGNNGQPKQESARVGVTK